MSAPSIESSADRGEPLATSVAERPRRRGAPAWLGAIGYAIVLAEIVFFSLASEHFLQAGNFLNIVTQAAVYAVAAFGVTVVVIIGGDDVARGGIDLSTGAVLGFTGAFIAVLLAAGWGFLPAVLLGLLAAAAVGAVNGLSVVAGVRPLLVTLATMSIMLSLTIVITGNVKIAVEHPAMQWLRDGGGGLLVLALVFAALLLLGRSRLGAQAYAVGQNRTAARVAGLSPNRFLVGSYIVSAVLAGIAGLLMTGRLSAALPGIGEQALISILLASFMSVAFSRRLVVTISGTLFSAVFVSVLDSGFISLGVQSQWVGVTKGALILVVLAIAAVRERRVRR